MAAIIKGKEIELNLDMGALRNLKKLTGKGFFSLTEEDFVDDDMLFFLVLAMAQRKDSTICEEDIDAMSFIDFVRATEEAMSALKEFYPESEGDEKLKEGAEKVTEYLNSINEAKGESESPL